MKAPIIPHRSRPRHHGLPVILILLMIGILLTGCEINEPAMPTFDTTVTIPLGVERIDILETIEDQDYLEVQEDGSLGFTIDGDPTTMDFDFELSADIEGQVIEQGLGEFSIAAGDPVDFEFQLGDIWPAAAGFVGTPTIVPPFPIDVVSDGQDIPDIDSAQLTSGRITISLDNQLPFPVSADSGPDQVVVSLEDSATGTSFATMAFPAIPAGQNNTQSADLAGVTLPGDIQLRIRGKSTGSGGSIVTVNGTDSLHFQAGFHDLMVSSAMAVVGPQTFATSFATELPDDFAIQSAAISDGAITLAVSNNMPIPCRAVMTWNNLRDNSNNPLSRTFDLEASQDVSQAINFSGYTVRAENELLENLTAEVAITTPGSQGHSVLLDSAAGLTADLQGGSITFSSVTGEIPPTSVEIDPISEEIDLPDEMDGIELQAATMTLRVTNGAGLPADLNVVLSGTSASGRTVTMDVDQHIMAAEERGLTTNIVLNQRNSQIVEFLNNLPVSINLSGDVVVGGEGVIGTVHQDDYAEVTWNIVAPVVVVINGTTLDADPEALDLDDELREMIDDRAQRALVTTEILNHMPVGVQLTIKAHTDTTLMATQPLLTIGPLDVDAALVNPITHMVLAPVTSSPTFELTTEEAKIFGRQGLHTMLEVNLPPSDGTIRLLSTDFIEVRGVVQMDVFVDDEW